MSNSHINQSRRQLLKGSALALSTPSIPFLGALQALSTRALANDGIYSMSAKSPYGPLSPVKDEITDLELLKLPEGFQYMSFSWTGDAMSNGEPVPHGHDGMGVVGVQQGPDGEEIILIRNHELGTGKLIAASGVYDGAELPAQTYAAGGNTNLHFPRNRQGMIRTVPSLGGTMSNCAGGVTPWGTWLSCEETVRDNSEAGGHKHGYVFEVQADPRQTTGVPIVAMGRYKHEAAAVDPATSYVYLTEDNRNMSPIYRFIPNDRSQQASSLEKGGRLQAAKVRSVTRADLLAPTLGDVHELEWVEIADPDMAPEGQASGPYLQSRENGALTISRGEGVWYWDGKIFIVDTSAGSNAAGEAGHGEGAVWMLDTASDRLTCIFASADAKVGNNPDNISVSPRGGIVMCEDGSGVEDEFGFGERLLGLDASGDAFILAKNNIILTDDQIKSSGKQVIPGDYRGQEIAGACFDPTGEILFMNIQTPGITFAIWGPWEKGPI